MASCKQDFSSAVELSEFFCDIESSDSILQRITYNMNLLENMKVVQSGIDTSSGTGA